MLLLSMTSMRFKYIMADINKFYFSVSKINIDFTEVKPSSWVLPVVSLWIA